MSMNVNYGRQPPTYRNRPLISYLISNSHLYLQNSREKPSNPSLLSAHFPIYAHIILNQSLYKQYMFGGLSQGYEQLWRAIIRPPRAQYTPEMLGPKIFKSRGLKIERRDIELVNKQGLKLQCSFYQPVIRPCKLLPCVIYLHGNASCRLEGAGLAHYLLSRNMTVFTFDFAGCGLSQGEYISLGYYERDDVDCVFKYLRGLETVSSIGIWGRSMGAVTALMYADTNHEIGCVVLDSPFSNLEKLSKELAEKHGGKLSVFSGIALSFVKSTIKQKHNFNIEDLDPISHVKNAYIPAFFIHGKADDFIVPKHSQDLYAKYSGEKRIKIVEGDHNSDRPEEINEEIATFFYYGLCVGELVQEDKEYMQEQQKQKEKEKQKKKVKPNEEEEDQAPEEAFNYEVNQAELEEELIKQAIALSLAESEKQANKK